jgi:hypothetical protein
MGPMRYRPHGEQGIAEIPPDTCPAGHPLRPPNVSVGWDGIGRTYTCWRCYKAGAEVHTLRYEVGLAADLPAT